MIATSWRVAERTPGRYPTTERPLWIAISSMHCVCVITPLWITRISLTVYQCVVVGGSSMQAGSESLVGPPQTRNGLCVETQCGNSTPPVLHRSKQLSTPISIDRNVAGMF